MKINVYQIPLAFSLLGAAAMVVLPLFGMAQAQAQKIGIGIMLIGIVVMSIALTLGLGLKKDGDK